MVSEVVELIMSTEVVDIDWRWEEVPTSYGVMTRAMVRPVSLLTGVLPLDKKKSWVLDFGLIITSGIECGVRLGTKRSLILFQFGVETVYNLMGVMHQNLVSAAAWTHISSFILCALMRIFFPLFWTYIWPINLMLCSCGSWDDCCRPFCFVCIYGVFGGQICGS